MSAESSQSGGILCFSYSQSSSSSSSDNSHSFFSFSDGCVIRIPGPQVSACFTVPRVTVLTLRQCLQILGYIMQLTENDKTVQMPAKLPDHFFVPDADYDAVTSGVSSSTSGPSSAPTLQPSPSATITTTNSSLSTSIENALKAANLPSSVITQVQNSVASQLHGLQVS